MSYHYEILPAPIPSAEASGPVLYYVLRHAAPESSKFLFMQQGGPQWKEEISPEFIEELNCWRGHIAASLLAVVMAREEKWGANVSPQSTRS